MINVFGQSAQNAGLRLSLMGAARPALIEAIYPMEALTKFHYRNHIAGLTGRWMDTGSTIAGSVARGSRHRLFHGHHLFQDGYRVLINRELKFGQFLHHLGMDFLTKRGIPNPLLPTALAPQLVRLGLSKELVYEFMTVNLPKILGGSVALVCAGVDVYLAFSDAIPHTFLASGMHFALGMLDIACGYFTGNALFLASGVAELGVGAATLYRTIVDPIMPLVGVPGSVFFPSLGQAVLLGGIVGACVGYFNGNSWSSIPKNMTASMGAAAAATVTTYATAGVGYLAPLVGPMAGICNAPLKLDHQKSFLIDTLSQSFV